jgi:hypothetical protein
MRHRLRRKSIRAWQELSFSHHDFASSRDTLDLTRSREGREEGNDEELFRCSAAIASSLTDDNEEHIKYFE